MISVSSATPAKVYLAGSDAVCAVDWDVQLAGGTVYYTHDPKGGGPPVSQVAGANRAY